MIEILAHTNTTFDFQLPLNRLSEYLGDSTPSWSSREEFEQIVYWNEDFNRSLAISIPLSVYQELSTKFGDALTFRFSLGGSVVLDLSQPINQEVLDRFQDQTRQAVTLIIDFRVDKRALLESAFPDLAQSCKTFFFIYSETLERFIINSNLSQVETQLWGDQPDQKIVIIVPEKPVFLNGSYLAVVGGEHLTSLDTIIPTNINDPLISKGVFERCENSVKWQTSFVRQITPLNLDFSILAGAEDPITRALLIHRINLVLLFTADRSIIRNRTWVSIFISSQQSVEIKLVNREQNISENLICGAQVLFDLFNWVYDTNWKVSDRIPLVQIGIVQALIASDPDTRYRLLIENSKSIYDGLQWHWKAFIEGKVEEYVRQILDLELFVSDTVRTFAEQISVISKNLNETMLAAVGVFIASFVAALFTSDFNPTVFRIGLLVYAGYILVFPMIISMLQHYDQFKIYKEDFELRRKRFEDRLYKDKVEQIVGKQIDKSTARFKRSAIYTVSTYLLVTFMLIAAAIILPEVIQRSIVVPTTTVTPTAIVTSTSIQSQITNPTTQPFGTATPIPP